MPTTDQLVYAAIVSALKSRLYPGLVTFTGESEAQFTAFEDFPLSQEGVRYVLEADAAAFYEYVDHERLAYELIGATGEPELTEALTSMLEGWMQATRGLPQGPPPSAPISDI